MFPTASVAETETRAAALGSVLEQPAQPARTLHPQAQLCRLARGSAALALRSLKVAPALPVEELTTTFPRADSLQASPPQSALTASFESRCCFRAFTSTLTPPSTSTATVADCAAPRVSVALKVKRSLPEKLFAAV